MFVEVSNCSTENIHDTGRSLRQTAFNLPFPDPGQPLPLPSFILAELRNAINTQLDMLTATAAAAEACHEPRIPCQASLLWHSLTFPRRVSGGSLPSLFPNRLTFIFT
jgi:hypothetical protein